MPTYEYECQDCRIRFERKQSFTEEPIKECPECRGQTRRVLHPVGIVFKGSGFYITDSRSSSTATVGAKESSCNGDNGSSETKSSTSEAKSEKCQNCDSKSEAKACSAMAGD